MGTHHRPSDDLSTFGEPTAKYSAIYKLNICPAFLTPANAMLSVELTNLAEILESAGKSKNVSTAARKWSSQIKNAIMQHTVRSFLDTGLLVWLMGFTAG